MRLLNLWPVSNGAHTLRSPITRLIQEFVFMLLLISALLVAAYLFLSWRNQTVEAVNNELTKNMLALQNTKAGGVNNLQIDAYLSLRAKNAGQLNWLVALSKVTDEHAQLTQVTEKDNDLIIVGQADSVTDAQSLIGRVNQMFVQSSLESLESKAERGSVTWVFVMRASSKIANKVNQ